MGQVKANPKKLSSKGSRIFAIGMVVSIILMAAAIFIAKWQMDDTKEVVTADLEQQYGEPFTITWSNLNKRPLSGDFQGTVQADETGYIYEFIAKDYKMDIDYEQVNKEMAVNDDVEAAIEGGLSVTTFDGDTANIRVLLETVNAPVDDAAMQQLGEALKAEHGLATVNIDVYEIVDRAFEAAAQQLTVFQRSLIPADAFETYEPVIEKFTF